MKDLNMMAWITQLGISVALPLGGFVLLSVWLRAQFGLGNWIVFIGCIIGLVMALDGLRYSLKVMSKMDGKQKKGKPPVSYNDHE